MYVTKGYQTSARLQAIYALSNTKIKLFLTLIQRIPKGKWSWILRAVLAGELKRNEKTISRLTDDLEKLKLIEKVRHAINPAHECAYKITEWGYQVAHIIQKLYTPNNYLVLTTCLLLSPVKTNVPRVNLDVFIKEVSSSSSYSKLQTAPARDPQITQISQTTARKEADVGSKEHKTMDLPEHVVQLTPLLQLTPHGQLKLCIFDQETVDYAWASVKQANSCKDVFKELVELCFKSYEANDRKPDWFTYYDAEKAGLFSKKDKHTAKTITSAMIKPKVAKQDVNPFAESASFTAYKNRDKSKDPVRWIDQQERDNPDRHRAKAAEYLSYFEDLRGEKAPSDVKDFLKVEVVVSKPAEWSQTDKQLVDWALNYIGKMTVGKAFYAAFVEEILLGPDSPRARTGELQAGLKLMQRLAYQQLTVELEQQAPEKKVVTELKDQIVCAQIANDDRMWENMKYSPIDGDELYDEVYT
jgi:hypothetical protein